MKVRELIAQSAHAFQQAGMATARLDAEVLLYHCLKSDRLALIKDPDRRLDERQREQYDAWVRRRLQGEPVAYITGRKEFWSLDFEVNPQVLIPRPETELLVEETLALANPEKGLRILDLGTGSGAIAVALARELKNASLVATDISPEALATARRNARAHGVENRIEFLCGDLFSPLEPGFDIIVSNPPYIAADEFVRLPVGVRQYEPAVALVAGSDGLAVIRAIIYAAPQYLRPGGWLILEIGPGQEAKVADLFEKAGLGEATFRRDYAGHWRMARARRVEKNG